MARFLRFLRLVLALLALMFGTWLLSRWLLPEEALRPYFTRLYNARVGELTFGRILLANLFPFFGVQFMNLFCVRRLPGGLYVMPVFWVVYGLVLGSNSFVFAGDPIPISPIVLWQRTGFNELMSYTLAYEASPPWQLWEQLGPWRTRRLPDRTWRPTLEDAAYWVAAIAVLVVAVAREVASA